MAEGTTAKHARPCCSGEGVVGRRAGFLRVKSVRLLPPCPRPGAGPVHPTGAASTAWELACLEVWAAGVVPFTYSR